MIINKLYSLMVETPQYDTTDRFSKVTSPVFHTKKSKQIQTILLSGLTDTKMDRLPLFASVICYMVRFSIFGDEISELDKVNTYVPIERTDTDITSNMCMYDLTDSTAVFTDLLRFIDIDIKDRLVAATFIDYMAAGCLQMLREVSE